MALHLKDLQLTTDLVKMAADSLKQSVKQKINFVRVTVSASKLYELLNPIGGFAEILSKNF